MVNIKKISNISELYKKFTTVLKRLSADVTVDLGKLGLVDSATLQLILVFVHGVEQKGHKVSWERIPPEMLTFAADIGLSEALGWNSPED